MVRKVNFDTSSKKERSVLGELSKGSFFSNHIIKNTEGTFDNGHSVSVVLSSSNVKSMFFLSGISGNSKSGLGVSDILDSLSEINFGFISGVFAGREVVGSSS